MNHLVYWRWLKEVSTLHEKEILNGVKVWLIRKRPSMRAYCPVYWTLDWLRNTEVSGHIQDDPIPTP